MPTTVQTTDLLDRIMSIDPKRNAINYFQKNTHNSSPIILVEPKRIVYTVVKIYYCLDTKQLRNNKRIKKNKTTNYKMQQLRLNVLLNFVVVVAIASMTTTTAMVLREPASRKVIVKAVDSNKKGASTSKAKQGEWSPSSWRTKESTQIPVYPDQEALEEVERELSKSAPLVFAGEVRTLSEQLALASQGKTFVLFGGDCAESFDEFSVNHIQDTFRVILQMSLILTHGGSKPVVKIGRMAGKI